ncbi:DUF2812 domain-containing protein [Evansella sp. AB-rgal1]|uniref:DUF2812 domain-containing protein n=1 Tax=Evansella sp. AB-rgal1 TaxID=3242696 RepID=UPI00359E7006
MNTLKKSWYLWWGWNPEKVENWLELMESKGWNLYQVDMLANRFKFKKDKRRTVRYCVDFQPNIDAQYITIFADDTWELIWSNEIGWYIWKKEYEKERPSIYTDYNSLIERNNRLIGMLKPMFSFLIFIFLFLVFFRSNHVFINQLFWIYSVLITTYIVIFFQIKRSNKKLKKNRIKE